MHKLGTLKKIKTEQRKAIYFAGTPGPSGSPGWGVTRNLTNIHEFQQMPLGDKFACKQDNEDSLVNRYCSFLYHLTQKKQRHEKDMEHEKRSRNLTPKK